MSVSASAPELFTQADHGDEPHQLVILTPAASTWLQDLAARYRRLRSGTMIEPSALSLDGVEILDIESLKSRLATSQLAARRGGNFDVLRSDLGEVLLHYVGQEFGGFQYGYQSIRDRELRNLPGRSLDQIGVKMAVGPSGQTTISLMLGEAKVSADKKVPPSVVDIKDDSLSKSHAKQLSDVTATAEKIWHAYRFCVDEDTQQLFGLAVTMFEQAHPQLTVHATSALVRPSSAGTVEDFGSYRDNPDQFDGAIVNFYILRADSDDIEAIVDDFIELASVDSREAAQ